MTQGETWKAIGQFREASINECGQRAKEKQRKDIGLHTKGWPHFTEVLLRGGGAGEGGWRGSSKVKNRKANQRTEGEKMTPKTWGYCLKKQSNGWNEKMRRSGKEMFVGNIVVQRMWGRRAVRGLEECERGKKGVNSRRLPAALPPLWSYLTS